MLILQNAAKENSEAWLHTRLWTMAEEGWWGALQGFLRDVPVHFYLRNLCYKTAQVFITSLVKYKSVFAVIALNLHLHFYLTHSRYGNTSRYQIYVFFSLDITSLSVISIILQICWKMLLQTDIYQEHIFEKVKGTLCCTKYWANCTKSNHERPSNLQVIYNYWWDHWPQLCKIGCSGCQKLWQLRKDIKQNYLT